MRARHVIREVVRVSVTRHRGVAAVCAAVTAAVGLLALWATPEVWVVRSELLVSEPVTVHRLTTPFSEVPSQYEELAGLPEQLRSRENRVLLVKRTGLLEQWEASRPAPRRALDWVLARIRGAPAEKDLLDALVEMLDKRLIVSVERSRLIIEVRWPTREAALALSKVAVSLAQQQRESSTIRTLVETGIDLEERLASTRAEIKSLFERLEVEVTQAAAQGRFASTDAEEQQLLTERQRAAELDALRADNQISVDVLRRTNAMRFWVVHAPELPRKPQGQGPLVVAFAFVVAVTIAGFGGALGLALSGGHVVSGRQLERATGLKVLTSLPTDWWGPRERPRPLSVALVVLLAVATGAVLGATKGNLVLALVPLVGALGLWLVWTLPLKWPLTGLLLLAVSIDDPTDRPYAELWRSPLYRLGEVFYHNVLWFTGFELLLMGLGVLMVLRSVLDSGRRAAALDPRGSSPRALRLSMALSAAAVAALAVFGVATGGVFREALWQFRVLLILPLMATLFLYAFEFPRDLKLLFGVLLFGSLVKSTLGLYFIYRVAAPMGAAPPHTTGHNDSMILATAVVVAVLLIWERAKWKYLVLFMAWMPFVFMALKHNDRRVAYVDIGVTLLAVFLLSERVHRVKRFVSRVALAMFPVIALYVAAGWSSHSSVFQPVAKLRSIVAPEEDSEDAASNLEREVENYNIIRTWQNSMVIGVGFGHHFIEYRPVFDFGQSGFGLIGHNAILWLMWIGGVVGFTLVLLYLGVTAFLFARTLRVARAWKERVALFASLSMLTTYLLQAFFDMGLTSLAIAFYVAMAVAIIGQLASRYGVLEWKGAARAGAQWPVPRTVQVSRASG